MASVRAFDSNSLDLERRELPGRRFLSGLTKYLSAIREARAAAQAYDEMVRTGTPHEVAVQRMFEQHFGARR